MQIRRLAVAVVAVVFVWAMGGCTKLVPASVDDFGAAKTVVVTLRDGETLKGRVSVGSPVTYTTFGRVYRAEVEDITAGNITLTNVYVQEEYEKYRLQRERMEGAELHVVDETESIYIPAYKITSVEEVVVDRMKSARGGLFWTFTTIVVIQIMNARF